MSHTARTAETARLIIATLVTFVLVGSGWVAYRRLVRERWAAPLRAQEARLAAAVETFCAADAELASDPFFQRSARTSDAAAFLHGLLGFDGTASDGGVTLTGGTLTITPEVRRLLSQRDFMDAELPEGAVDTSALAQAHAFDHWELTGAGSPWTPAADWTLAEAPMPRFTMLLAGAKAHLIAGARGGTLPQAARDVRQLARLCLSSESLIGAMVALALADAERRAHAWAVARGADVGDWRPVDEARVRRARAVMMLSSSFLGPTADEETLGRALSCAHVSRCVGLTESTTFTGSLSTVLPEPAATRMRVTFSATRTPGPDCAFAMARYFASRPPALGTSPGWMPQDDVGGLLLLLSSRDVDPLAVLADAGVPAAPTAP